MGADVNVGGVTVPSFVQRKVSTRLRLRDGESNLLAGLLQTRREEGRQRVSRRHPRPVPQQRVLEQHDVDSDQTEIVMLLTPHIVRTHDITEADLRPIFIGSQQNLGIGGPPPLIAPQQPEGAAPPAAPHAGAGRRRAEPACRNDADREAAGPRTRRSDPGRAAGIVAGAGHRGAAAGHAAGDAAGADAAARGRRHAAAAADRRRRRRRRRRRTTPAGTPDAVPTTSPGIGSAQVLISPPGPTFRVGGGPYTVPLLINDASRISTVTLTLIFDPTKLRVRSVQEGSFLRAGGVPVVFTQAVNGNRVDITLSRSADATGASGTGVLSAILFDAIAPGPVTMTLSGTATGPGGTGDGAAVHAGDRDGAVSCGIAAGIRD